MAPDGGGRRRLAVDGGEIEYCWLEPKEPRPGPPLVFLHEGLGSIDLWRSYPADVVAGTGRRGLVYSRLGYGWSTPVRAARPVEYMHDEALEVLPRIIDALAVEQPLLIGHSDGASIALLYASSRPAAGLVLLAPHVFVEDQSVIGIGNAGATYADTDLAEKMAKYHHDAESTFRGWNDVWASEPFRRWNIESVLPDVHCSVLCIQGLEDDYGTVAQLDAIEAGVAGSVERLELGRCGHAPHLERPDVVTPATVRFVATVT